MVKRGWIVRRQDLREKLEKRGRPSYNDYDGLDKWWTKQCMTCLDKWTVGEDEICTKGVAWKILYKNMPDGSLHKPRICSFCTERKVKE